MEKQIQSGFAAAGTGVWPQQRCKTLHLIRHAQGIHNVASEKNHDLLSSFDYFDAHLTPLGSNQVDNLREHVQGSGLSKRIELVITSPMLRTMQTAVGAFGHDVIDARNSLNSPPFMAVELCRERLGVNPCDKRRSIDEYKSLFPAFDFSQIESNEDILWRPDVRESDEELAARGLEFFNWLWTLKEKEIAIVTHSAFLHETLKCLYEYCHPSVKNELSTKFLNCELRSLVIIDRRVLISGKTRQWH